MLRITRDVTANSMHANEITQLHCSTDHGYGFQENRKKIEKKGTNETNQHTQIGSFLINK